MPVTMPCTGADCATCKRDAKWRLAVPVYSGIWQGLQTAIVGRYDRLPQFAYHLLLGVLSLYPPCCIAYFLMFDFRKRGDWARSHDVCNHQRVLCWFHHKLCEKKGRKV